MSDETASLTPGFEDHSYRLAGEESGIRRLVDRFYDLMDTEPVAKGIRHMHSPDLSQSNDKLWRFLCGWLGGPRLYKEKYGPINIPGAHAHLAIGEKERDAWMHCMSLAIDEQSYPLEFKEYLKKQLAIPADRCRNRF